jgi:hypothetical protein
VRAPASITAAIVVSPSASSQAFAQIGAEEPMMRPPHHNALGARGKRGDISLDKTSSQNSSPM